MIFLLVHTHVSVNMFRLGHIFSVHVFSTILFLEPRFTCDVDSIKLLNFARFCLILCLYLYIFFYPEPCLTYSSCPTPHIRFFMIRVTNGPIPIGHSAYCTLNVVCYSDIFFCRWYLMSKLMNPVLQKRDISWWQNLSNTWMR